MDFITALFLQPTPRQVIALGLIVLAFAAFTAIVWFMTSDELQDIDAVHREADEHSNAGCAGCGGCSAKARNAACDAVTIPPPVYLGTDARWDKTV